MIACARLHTHTQRCLTGSRLQRQRRKARTRMRGAGGGNSEGQGEQLGHMVGYAVTIRRRVWRDARHLIFVCITDWSIMGSV